MSASLDDMYRDIILDHYRAPRGREPLPMADFSTGGHNPACGDQLELAVKIDDDIVKDIYVDCKGCAISTASSSMLAEILKGKTVAEAKKIATIVRAMLKGDEDVKIPEDLGDIDALEGVKKFPVRIKCALLAWVTFMEGLENYQNSTKNPDSPTTLE